MIYRVFQPKIMVLRIMRMDTSSIFGREDRATCKVISRADIIPTTTISFVEIEVFILINTSHKG
jgi:hypothetical protein